MTTTKVESLRGRLLSIGGYGFQESENSESVRALSLQYTADNDPRLSSMDRLDRMDEEGGAYDENYSGVDTTIIADGHLI